MSVRRSQRSARRRTFYTAFQTPEEYRLVSAGQQLGTMPIDFPLYDGLLLIFAARRWRVIAVHHEDKTVQLTPAGGGKPPQLNTGPLAVHAVVRERMRTMLEDDTVPAYLDVQSRTLLEQARREYATLELDRAPIVLNGSDSLVFAWTSDRVLTTIVEILNVNGMEAAAEGPALRLVGTTREAAIRALAAIADGPPLDPITLAHKITNKELHKFDTWLSESLLSEQFATAQLDCPGAIATATALCESIM